MKEEGVMAFLFSLHYVLCLSLLDVQDEGKKKKEKRLKLVMTDDQRFLDGEEVSSASSFNHWLDASVEHVCVWGKLGAGVGELKGRVESDFNNFRDLWLCILRTHGMLRTYNMLWTHNRLRTNNMLRTHDRLRLRTLDMLRTDDMKCIQDSMNAWSAKSRWHAKNI